VRFQLILVLRFTEDNQVGYTVIALSQTVAKKVDSKSHTNPLESLLPQLKPRPGIVLLKRLNIVLDEDSEKGFGLVCFPYVFR
jgi:ribonuclease P/MRP protein subunit RPP1